MFDPNTVKTIKDRFRGFLPVVVDVETAGFIPEKNALVEVAMMTVNMDERGVFTPGELYSANILPFSGSIINEANIKFLGIDPFDKNRNPQDEAEAILPMFKAVSKAVKAAHCKRAILVGHNGHFDLGFINAVAERIGKKKNPFHPFSVLDTASLAGLVYGQTVLAKACRAAHLDFDDHAAHGAAYDAQMECRLFCSLINRFNLFAGFPESFEEDETDAATSSENLKE